MARNESDREDLLREATALVERIELTVTDVAFGATCVVAGFRKDGALSLFFDADPVYQFNAPGELRRAYAKGLLYKAVRARLVSLERVRTPDEVQLLRRDLTPAQERVFLQTMRSKLLALATLLQQGQYTVVGQVPPTTVVLARLQAWLNEHNDPPIAASPHV